MPIAACSKRRESAGFDIHPLPCAQNHPRKSNRICPPPVPYRATKTKCASRECHWFSTRPNHSAPQPMNATLSDNPRTAQSAPVENLRTPAAKAMVASSRSPKIKKPPPKKCLARKSVSYVQREMSYTKTFLQEG